MKPGWKTRIDERRYFEELRAKQAQQKIERLKQKAVQEALRMVERIAFEHVSEDTK